jgi:Tfp pilus assembly protein PilN
MIRVPINLASEPFRPRRAQLVALSAAAALLAAVLAAQLLLAWNDRRQAAHERAEIAQLNAQLAQASRQQAQLEGALRQGGNAVVFEQNLFLNQLIARKGISWTRLFADLEQVLPYNVRLIAVRLPQIDAHNRVLLDMIVGANDPAPVLDLLRKLEESPRFGPASVYNSLPPTQTEKLLRYRISVNYAQKL